MDVGEASTHRRSVNDHGTCEEDDPSNLGYPCFPRGDPVRGAGKGNLQRPRLWTHAGAAKNKRPDRGRSLCEGNRSRDRRIKGVHATVFHDPLGEVSARRDLFHYYPDRAWVQRIIWETGNAWHYGQYNFLDRLIARKDPVAIPVCLGRFAEAVMRLSMLLNRDYTPYWKWLAAEFRKTSGTGQLDASLQRLFATPDISEQAAVVQEICDEIHAKLVELFSLNPKPTEHPHPLHCATREMVTREGGRWSP